MTIVHYDRRATIWQGDCLQILPDLETASVHAIVTDPPYGLEFMGKDWDQFREARAYQHWCRRWATECLRVLKPGGFLLSFGGTRTWHRLACGIEDAGFEMRDSIAWLHGQGFPKSLDVSKAIDKVRDRTLIEQLANEIKRARAEAGMSLREIGQVVQEASEGQYGEWYHRGGHMFFETGQNLPSRPEWKWLRRTLPIRTEFLNVYAEAERTVIGSRKVSPGVAFQTTGPDELNITAPATPDAARWQGWGTALKPAFEPIIVARKPVVGTVAANVLEHSTGALNIDGCRVAGEVPTTTQGQAANAGMIYGADQRLLREFLPHAAGRWPTNVVLTHNDGCEQTGSRIEVFGGGGSTNGSPFAATYELGTGFTGHVTEVPVWACVEGCPVRELDAQSEASRFYPTFRYQAKATTAERPRVEGGFDPHPTVKPLALMRWLVRLVTPPNGIVLDPFLGSGTTAEAALLEGFRTLGIELDFDYVPLIEVRLNRAAEQLREAAS